MTISIFLARVLGLYCLIACLAIVVRRKNVEQLTESLKNNQALLYMSGLWSLLVGLFVVVSHPILVWDWPVLITILGCLAVMKGALHLFFPHQILRLAARISYKSYYLIVVIVFLVVGAYLTYMGFWG